MLTAARDLVRQHGVISLQEVARELDAPIEVAQALLQKWVAKGRIEQLPTPSACSGCALCDAAARRLYRCCERADPAAAEPGSEPGSKLRVPRSCPAAGPPQSQR